MASSQAPLFPLPAFRREDKPAGTSSAPPGHVMLLGQALVAFHEQMLRQDLSPNTVKAFDSDLRLLARYVGGDCVVAAISRDDLAAFIRYLRYERGVPCKLKSLERRLTALKVFFAWLTQEGVLDVDPAAALLHHPVTTPLPQVLSDEYVARLLTATDSRCQDASQPDARPHLLVILLLSTGVKKGECMRIALTDIDTSDANSPTVLIRYDNVRQIHKERRLRLPPRFGVVLGQYLAQYRPVAKLFECTARNLEYVLDNSGALAKLPPRCVSFEALRWTCALRDLRAGMDEDALRRKLGLSPITWAETLDKLNRLNAPAL
jgi:integrase/recombinase XerD